MKVFIRKSMLAWMAALALIVAAAPVARAQQAPALTVSLAGSDEILGDIRYVTSLAGFPDAGGIAELFAKQYTDYLDASKPAGVVVRFEGSMPVVTGFVAVKDMEGLTGKVSEMLGLPEDVGGGVQRYTLDQPIYFKQDGDWLYLSNSVAGTASMPNPDAAIADLVKSYDIGIRANIPAVPEGLRQMALGQMQQAFEMQMEMQAAQADSPEEAEAQRKLSEQAMAQMVRAFDEVEEVTLGLSIDQDGKNVHMDMSVTAKAGSKLAGQLAVLEGLTSNFTGFLQPDAAAVMHFASVMNDEEKTQMKAWMATIQKQAAAEIDNDDSLDGDADKAAVKKVLGSLMEVVNKTIDAGKMDGGAVLKLDNGVNFVAGGYTADGNALAEAFKELVELAKNEPDFPEVKFNAAEHAGVTFHTMSMPIPEGEEEARAALGETVEVLLGTGQDSAFVAFGKSAMDLTKKVIDESKAAGAKKVNPMMMTIAIGPILQFAQKMDPDNAQLSAIASAVGSSQGSDKITASAKMIERGVTYRFQVDAGVIELVAKAAAEGGGGGGF